ncbi:hypothetical protein ACUN8C_04685 [Kushneria sp. Sum13]|uniref:hypothetical protein n=1 Tax=Kushneria sp. Sum13 TaxID=3459196 RepID=UPI004045FC8B
MKWITAIDLEAWGRTIDAALMLPELVADLISATAPEIRSIRFPSGGKGQVRGFDGVLESMSGMPNVPQGRSVWEFGTSVNYQKKAQSDFDSRTNSISEDDQKDLTLVLVTPFTWDSSNGQNKIEDWVQAHKESSSWKDLILIDGVKLEHWLDQAPAVAAKHARRTLKTAPIHGVRSIDEFWSDFSSRFDPQLIEKILTAEREALVERLLGQLMGPPQVIKLIGDALDHVTAFAVAAIRSAHPEAKEYLEARTLIVDTHEAGRALYSKSNLVFLLRGEAAQTPIKLNEPAPVIVPLARSQRIAEGTSLPRQSNFAISRALIDMGIEELRADQLARGSGSSLAALERSIPGGACNTPPWINSARQLVPAFLAGGWDSANSLDREILETLAGYSSYHRYEQEIRGFINQEDAPFEREDTIFKVRAPLDAFIHAGDQIGEEYLDLLRPVMQKVFSELDPDPDPNQPIYMRETKARYSDWLRDGLATALLMIAVWEQQARLPIRCGAGQAFANEIIESLPGLGKDPRILTSLKNELPLLAEAAPSPFIEALEQMLEGDGEAIRPIFDEIEGFAFPTSQHTGLLWALETLAWHPKWFRRVCLILARMAEIDPGGRLTNRPINSLIDILLLWSPSTLAGPEARLALLDEIIKQNSEIGWTLLLKLLPGATQSTSGTSRLRLRGTEIPPPRTITHADLWKSQREVIERAIIFCSGDLKRMQELIAPMMRFPDVQYKAAVSELEAVLAISSGKDRGNLWSTLNDEVKHQRRFVGMDWALNEADLASLEMIIEKHPPADPVISIAGLFNNSSINRDSEKDSKSRTNAISELANSDNSEAILRLIKSARSPFLVLRAIDDSEIEYEFISKLVRDAFSIEGYKDAAGRIFDIYRRKVGIPKAICLAKSLYQPNKNEKDLTALFYTWPTNTDTWRAIAKLGDQVLDFFWWNYPALPTIGTRRELISVACALLRRGRATIALESIQHRLEEVPTHLLLKTLDLIIIELNSEHYPTHTSLIDYEIGQLFSELDDRQLSDTAIGQREYALLPLLRNHRRKLKLYLILASDPATFHYIVRDVYRAENDTEPTGNLTEEKRNRWRQAYQVLSDFDLTPGFLDTPANSELLKNWIDQVRALGQTHDRVEITEIVIGNVLAHAPEDDIDTGWPHRFVRNEIERSPSNALMRGLRTERFNMRGVTTRGVFDGGQQERDLAIEYRRHAVIAQTWPRTSNLLSDIAESWDQEAEREDLVARQQALRN